MAWLFTRVHLSNSICQLHHALDQDFCCPIGPACLLQPAQLHPLLAIPAEHGYAAWVCVMLHPAHGEESNYICRDKAWRFGGGAALENSQVLLTRLWWKHQVVRSWYLPKNVHDSSQDTAVFLAKYRAEVQGLGMAARDTAWTRFRMFRSTPQESQCYIFHFDPFWCEVPALPSSSPRTTIRSCTMDCTFPIGSLEAVASSTSGKCDT